MNNSRIRLEFKKRCLKQDKVTFTPNSLVNLFIVYELDRWSKDLNVDFARKYYLFAAVKKLKMLNLINVLIQGMTLDLILIHIFHIPNFDWGKHVIIFAVDMSSYVHIDNENKDILILGKGKTQGLYNTALTAAEKYYIDFLR